MSSLSLFDVKEGGAGLATPGLSLGLFLIILLFDDMTAPGPVSFELRRMLPISSFGCSGGGTVLATPGASVLFLIFLGGVDKTEPGTVSFTPFSFTQVVHILLIQGG